MIIRKAHAAALLALIAATVLSAAPKAGHPNKPGTVPGASARFDYVDYRGSDPVDTVFPVGPGEYRNPILPGFHPDPSIVRVGRDYYVVNSSFAYYPGLPIFHSRDLVNWTQIGNAIDRPGMLKFAGLGVARAVFAPTIRYHAGRFFIINTCTDCGGNFIITATAAAGPWSNPVFLPEVDGIDAEIFFDDDNRAWITNNGPPVGAPRYTGHRALWIQQLDLKRMKMTGNRTVIVDGGVRPAENPIWTEGPHIIKRDGWYYLLAAEGGTAGEHSETVYRSRSVTGPYQPGPINPILTQRDLAPTRPYPVYATGHADLVQTPKGEWWAVFLGTRPYEGSLSNLGRETFMLPVDWPENGWPMILPAGRLVPQALRRPDLPLGPSRQVATWRETFVTPRLAPEWVMLRQPSAQWYSLGSGGLTLHARAESIAGTGNPSFLARRQQHSYATIETAMTYRPVRVGDRAGMVVFADEQHYFFIGVHQGNKGASIVVSKRDGADDPAAGRMIAAVPYPASAGRLRLRIVAKGPTHDFAYALPGGQWQTLVAEADGRLLASERSNQFTGTVVGILAERGN